MIELYRSTEIHLGAPIDMAEPTIVCIQLATIVLEARELLVVRVIDKLITITSRSAHRDTAAVWNDTAVEADRAVCEMELLDLVLEGRGIWGTSDPSTAGRCGLVAGRYGCRPCLSITRPPVQRRLRGYSGMQRLQ